MFSRAMMRGLVVGFLKGILKMLLKPYSREDLRWCIENRAHLVDLMKKKAPAVEEFLSGHLSKESLLRMMKSVRPDLYETLQTPEGQEWFEFTYADLKERLFGRLFE